MNNNSTGWQKGRKTDKYENIVTGETTGRKSMALNPES
jgi:hypothetical protein